MTPVWLTCRTWLWMRLWTDFQDFYRRNDHKAEVFSLPLCDCRWGTGMLVCTVNTCDFSPHHIPCFSTCTYCRQVIDYRKVKGGKCLFLSSETVISVILAPQESRYSFHPRLCWCLSDFVDDSKMWHGWGWCCREMQLLLQVRSFGNHHSSASIIWGKDKRKILLRILCCLWSWLCVFVENSFQCNVFFFLLVLLCLTAIENVWLFREMKIFPIVR